MKYETFTFENPVTGQLMEYVTVFIDESNAKTFPADEANPDYVQFLAELEAEKEVTDNA